MFKYELHMHSVEGSLCARDTAQEMVRSYNRAGYSGAVLTNHFIFGNTAVPKDIPWDERMQKYYDIYLDTLPLARSLDFDLFFGLEHAYGSGKEFLIYGIGCQFLKAHPDIADCPPEKFAGYIHEAGGFISHAHPFHESPHIDPDVAPRTDFIDGVEVYNHPDKPEANAQAQALCDRLGLIPTSGGDSHWRDHPGIGKAGVAFEHRIRTSDELVRALRAREGHVIKNGNII